MQLGMNSENGMGSDQCFSSFVGKMDHVGSWFDSVNLRHGLRKFRLFHFDECEFVGIFSILYDILLKC